MPEANGAHSIFICSTLARNHQVSLDLLCRPGLQNNIWNRIAGCDASQINFEPILDIKTAYRSQ